MGQTASNVTKIIAHPISWWKGDQQDPNGVANELMIPKGATIFVYKRRGSMYFDEDGDLAHEFYCEVVDRQRKRVVMRRRLKNLTPQGEVDLPHPRLHGDIPVILCDASRFNNKTHSQI